MLDLSDKDKDWLYLAMEEVAKKNNDILLNDVKKLLQKELKEALTAFLVREITVEKGPRKQGDPEKTIEKQKWNVLDFLCHYLPLVEGSNRGLQSDVNKTMNSIHNVLTNQEAFVKQLFNIAEEQKKLED